ncbi:MULTISPECIES: DJ-1/PfpI family protein [unclassified Mycobacterium]|uniref:DJ-1/PfpI family protein n=1 Tax=unclassified Mycobacterium TaxID=2642494 RepID=UPI0027415D2A|nr:MULTISPECIES: DJ-1/PfpI family protein [unclassified Mycobacterium]MDP7704890.1 DJ-1/PfpI family protein [Mycobacterium sp. TY815]MDP7723118.1 DJ-1/PfpI family protein [Mycobacterium sp. TY814]
MQVAIPVFPRFTALDAIGPYEVLQRIPSVEVVFVGQRRGEIRTENGMLGVACDATFDEVATPDVVVFPGGIGTRALVNDEAIRGWLHTVHPGTRYTTSVCTGALLLASAGLLNGLTATTHWRAADDLNRLGARYVPERVVEHLPQRIITAAGVSSGIDMALRLVELLFDRVAAQAAQLLIEYDPQPPFDSGAWARADEATRARALEFAQSRK